MSTSPAPQPKRLPLCSFHAEVQQQPQRGASLVGVMVAAALIGITLAISISGAKNMLSARRNATSSVAFLDAKDAIVQNLQQSLRAYAGGQCAPATIGSINTVQVGTAATLVRTKTISIPAGVGGTATADVARCTKNFQANTAPNSTSLYACFQVQFPAAVAAKADKLAFVASKAAFVEVLVHFKDLRTDSATACSALPPSKTGFGLETFYSIHWVANNVDGYLYKTSVGVTNASL